MGIVYGTGMAPLFFVTTNEMFWHQTVLFFCSISALVTLLTDSRRRWRYRDVSVCLQDDFHAFVSMTGAFVASLNLSNGFVILWRCVFLFIALLFISFIKSKNTSIQQKSLFFGRKNMAISYDFKS